MAQTFDTLDAARKMEAAGMDTRQAEAVATAIRAGQGELVSKVDLEATVAQLERRLMLYGLALAGALFAAIKYL